MSVLAMLELDGDPAELLAASAAMERHLSAPEGLLVRVAAPTDGGMVLFQLWESAEARQRNADDPAHASALESSGIKRLASGMRSRVFNGATLLHAVTVGE